MSQSEPQTVYISAYSKNTGSGKVFHTDPECSYLKLANGIFEKPRNVLFDDMDKCKACAGELNQPGGGWDTRRENGLGNVENTTCLSCGASKDPSEPCEWCERYEEVMGPHA